jgi:uncharacterized protein YndB with AHSA1/START domain
MANAGHTALPWRPSPGAAMMAAMHFRHEMAYAADADTVYAMLSDPAFRERVAAAQGVVSAEVAVAETAEGFSLSIDQVQRTDGLPGFARKFAGDTTRAIVLEEWPDRHGGTLTIDAPGKPSSIRGTVALVPSDAGTTEVVELEIKVKVPLIGGKLEGLLEEQVRAGLDVEHEVGQAWLRGDV